MIVMMALVGCLMVASFAAGYGTRATLSRKRRSVYLKYQPYLAPRRSGRSPQVLVTRQEESSDGAR